MSITKDHIINKVITTINCGEKDYQFLKHLSLESIISDAIDYAFDSYGAKNEQFIHIETIFIEIDVKTPKDFSVNKLAYHIKMQLPKLVEFQQENLPTTNKQSAQVNPINSLDNEFVHFLKTGKMNWFSHQSTQLRLDTLPTHDNSFLKKIKKVISNNHLSLQRFILQFSNEEIIKFLEQIHSRKQDLNITELLVSVKDIISKLPTAYSASYRMQKGILTLYVNLLLINGKQYLTVRQFLQNNLFSIAKVASKELIDYDKKFITYLLKKYKIEDALLNQDQDQSEKQIITLNQKVVEESAIIPIHKKPANIHVSNAGLILLHPFITLFFKKIGLIVDKQFRSLEHQQQAVCLLYYMATGETEFPEDELSFIKYLVNYPDEFPIPKSLPISEFEKQEALVVLQSAIHHWSALKNTTVDGLRHNFLNRSGVLTHDEIGAVLYVENDTADILLNKLPWGLSMVQFSWHPQLITIKWH